MYKVLWIVAARAGSKSLPNKNVKFLGNYPLLAYRILTAKKTNYNSHIWISTDSEEYASIAANYGAIIPFIRPKVLATDDAKSVDVVYHAMSYAEKLGLKFEYIALLEPTSPFITSDILNNAISVLDENKLATGIVAVKEHRPNTIFVQDNSIYLEQLSINLRHLTQLGRQGFNKQITPSGGFYISRWDFFRENKTFYSKYTLAHMVDELSGIEIDEFIDWQFAEFIIEKSLFVIK